MGLLSVGLWQLTAGGFRVYWRLYWGFDICARDTESTIWTRQALHISLLSLLVSLSSLRRCCCCYHQQKHTHTCSYIPVPSYIQTSTNQLWSEISSQKWTYCGIMCKKCTRILLLLCYKLNQEITWASTWMHTHTHTGVCAHTHAHIDRESGQCADLSKPFLNVYCSEQQEKREGGDSSSCSLCFRSVLFTFLMTQWGTNNVNKTIYNSGTLNKCK